MCVNQLVPTVQETYLAFDAHSTLKMMGKFFGHAKMFDKVWHAGLIYNLKSVAALRDLLKLTKNFMNNRPNRILLDDHTWDWLPVQASVPQISISGPLFFPIILMTFQII